jgi:AraC-like DNA-binding protein
MTTLLDTVAHHGLVNADRNGVAPSAIPGLATIRSTAPSGIMHAIARPIICLVVQGSKHVTMGTRSFDFGAGDSLLITADVPIVSQITKASAVAPYLSLVLELDPAVIAELAGQMKAAPLAETEPVRVDPTDAEVADAALRLMRLLDRPASIPVLKDQLIREMHYWLLAGKHGTAIRRLGWVDGHAGRIARAVNLLRVEFASSLPVERLAAEAGMSVSSFHEHFRNATSLSPRQFQKQLRLIEARRLMTSEGHSAGNAAFAVGYESVPQFTRDYGRLFGLSPGRDMRVARDDARSVA